MNRNWPFTPVFRPNSAQQFMPAGAVTPKDENPANQTICAPFGSLRRTVQDYAGAPAFFCTVQDYAGGRHPLEEELGKPTSAWAILVSGREGGRLHEKR